MELNNNPLASAPIKDYEFEELMRCPFKYYKRHVKGEKSNSLHWRQMVQYAVNHVINDIYSLPVEARSQARIYEIIHTRWKINMRLFESKAHYNQILAHVTTALLDHFSADFAKEPPLFLFETFSTWIEELQTELSMIFQVVEWSEQTFVIKKILVDEDSDVITVFKHMAILFSHKAFARLPSRIEIFSVLSGKTTIIEPKGTEDITQAIDYLWLTQQLLPTNPYRKTNSLLECNTCPFNAECHFTEVKQLARAL
ncbi:hypothetical protein EHS13_14255 [Paenibacillus psychroresistens]|uniref:PD-(D/E)XK endonuclease-like domain-containing protein n=1 Tax=Paenibacillus psychroresistens TaxID=1778678 RepID=A0A6B8RK25_9BACL|nr:hypothetical protein [Paenibacillus psychroresistens]QGQ95952.1 hypothetical protein EHS13_14255 [Paenibacillus psychroresistens]